MPDKEARKKIWKISIHAPRTGSDGKLLPNTAYNGHFNPRSPHGERQTANTTKHFCQEISIHAPRTGSDGRTARKSCAGGYFNPRSPHGERLHSLIIGIPRENFNPRSPHGERRWTTLSTSPRRHFNPRSPHGERRRKKYIPWALECDFNPRSPHGERRRNQAAKRREGGISIHAPRTGSDILAFFVHGCAKDFNPRSPHGERRWQWQKNKKHIDFNPRSPHGERLRRPA